MILRSQNLVRSNFRYLIISVQKNDIDPLGQTNNFESSEHCFHFVLF